MNFNKNKNDEMAVYHRMIEGDKNAFQFFFEVYHLDIYYFINMYVNNESISEELVQDIFIDFWEKRRKIKIQTSVKSYLLQMAKNRSLNFLRHEKVKLNTHLNIANTTVMTYEMPSSTLDSEELRDLIEKAVQKLPSKCRQIFRLAREEEYSYKQIADQLGISSKTVENQMGIALRKLRDYLRPYYNDIFLYISFFIYFF
ncbi:MAG TPA: RNA polymerase sigma-70 factor [Mariniphaga sp.]|nr:RNA polymerase sigma-70 factor [Mariniphaga sp.]